MSKNNNYLEKFKNLSQKELEKKYSYVHNEIFNLEKILDSIYEKINFYQNELKELKTTKKYFEKSYEQLCDADNVLFSLMNKMKMEE